MSGGDFSRGEDPDLVPDGEPVPAGDDDAEQAPEGEAIEPTSTDRAR